MYVIATTDDTEPAPIVGARKTTLDIFARLEWKSEPPEEAGLYWAIRKEEAYPEPEPVRITMMTWKSDKHYCWSTKADNLESVEAFKHWLGPLPTPELPKPIAQK